MTCFLGPTRTPPVKQHDCRADLACPIRPAHARYGNRQAPRHCSLLPWSLAHAGRFPEYADGSCQSLVKLLLLPTLLPAAPAPLQLHGLGAGLGLGLGGGTRGGAGGGAPGGGAGALVAGGGAPPGALEVAAGHAAAALWALTSNPQCRAWAQQVRTQAVNVMYLSSTGTALHCNARQGEERS